MRGAGSLPGARLTSFLWRHRWLRALVQQVSAALSTGEPLEGLPEAASRIADALGFQRAAVLALPDEHTGTIYLVAKTQETVSGTNHFVQRLYAINIQNGTDKTAPFLLGDTTGTSSYVNYASEAQNASTEGSQIWVYGSGSGTNDRITDPYNGTGLTVVQFNALREAQGDRPPA